MAHAVNHAVGRARMPSVVMLLTLLGTGVSALDNGLGRTPPMGFNPWNCFGTSAKGTQKLPGSHPYNASVIRAVADAIVNTGLAKTGYEYVNLDCGYSTGFRDAQGNLQVNQTLYPGGIKPLADYIHSKGLKFGIYSDAGAQQCCSRVHKNADDGSLGHEVRDAQLFASWGVDYLKHDSCGAKEQSYPDMRDALNKTGRPMFYSVHGPSGSEAIPIANIWRTTRDITNSWDSVMNRIMVNDGFVDAAGPGHFNDPDMLEVGNPPLSEGENRAHFSLWCIAKAPLLIGTDVTNMTASTLSILSNKDAIAINQDPLGEQAKMVSNRTGAQVWTGRLSGGYAVALVNTMDAPGEGTLTVSWSQLPGSVPGETKFKVYSVWDSRVLGIFSQSATVKVPRHDAALLTLSKAD
eukprot:m.227918 g.227918  ORF g.227918 m.227918 type:complete len:407 (-) comp18822_c0_seq3:57-1277(-)